MCGIAGYHRRNDAPISGLDVLAKSLLLGIENRGRDATGVLGLMDDGTWQIAKKTVPAVGFTKRHMPAIAGARTVLLHTRWATVGRADDPKNAHPVTSGTMAAIHNGTIGNATEIFEAFGLPRHAEVDSEVIPALCNHAGWAHLKDALSLLEGGAAIALVDREHPRELVFAKTRSYPLVYVAMDDLVVWASTEYAIKRAMSEAFGWTPSRSQVKELRDSHMVHINGEVPEPVRFAPDPPSWTSRGKAVTKAKGKQAPANTKAHRVSPPPAAGSKRQKRRSKRAAMVAKRSQFPAIAMHPDDDLAQDIAMDILIAEGYSLDEAYAIVRDEVSMANDWRRDWDESWDWDGDIPVYSGVQPERPAWHQRVYGNGRLVA